MDHEREKIIIPANKEDYLLASYKSELAFEAQDSGFSVQHSVKLASEDSEHIANISHMPTLSLAAPKLNKDQITALENIKREELLLKRHLNNLPMFLNKITPESP